MPYQLYLSCKCGMKSLKTGFIHIGNPLLRYDEIKVNIHEYTNAHRGVCTQILSCVIGLFGVQMLHGF